MWGVVQSINRLMKYDFNISRSELAYLIDEWIFNERDRNILKRRLLDGITYEKLAEEFDMSVRQIQYIVPKQLQKVIKHMG
jgi:DNA-directed RNA polymerase sigma subunit (sigma70/sigma32)